MSLESLLPNLVGPVAALVVLIVVCYLFITGKLHSDAEFRRVCAERDALQDALAAERKAVNEYAQTGNTTNKLIEALTQVATGGHGGRRSSPSAGIGDRES